MIRIISDSTCDLPKELLERYNIDIIPLHIHLGEEEYEDGKNITPEEIYRWSDEHNTTPKTAAVSMVEVLDTFEPVLKNGDDIISFSISDSMSTTGNVMCMAVEELEAEGHIHVINSANLSSGVGLLVLEAAKMAEEGIKAEDIVDAIEALKPRVRASFVVDTLTYLHRGGRCSSVAALAGGVLKLHPKIVVENGKMSAQKKYRGKINSVVKTYVKEMEENLLKAKKDRVFLTHSGCDEGLIEEVKAYLESLQYFQEIHVARAGSVISSHCGPGTLGVLYIDGE